MTLNANNDPTRTTVLRNQFAADLTRRWKGISSAINTSIVNNDIFGLKVDSKLPHTLVESAANLLTNATPLPAQAFAFKTSSAKVDGFMEWLRTQMDRDILGITTGGERKIAGSAKWANTYIDSSFKRGMRRADAELIKLGIVPTQEKQIFQIDARFLQPINADKVGLIYTRVFNELKGITSAMDQSISRTLAQGLAEGRGPRYISSAIRRHLDSTNLPKLDIAGPRGISGVLRSRILARTEVIRAHHVATINTYREAGIEGVKVKAEWSTAFDDRVCPDCADMEGRIFTLDEIESLIPLHPQCRCIALPSLAKTKPETTTKAEREDVVGDRYKTVDGSFKRKGFYEGKTGKPSLPDSTKIGKKVKTKKLSADELARRKKAAASAEKRAVKKAKKIADRTITPKRKIDIDTKGATENKFGIKPEDTTEVKKLVDSIGLPNADTNVSFRNGNIQIGVQDKNIDLFISVKDNKTLFLDGMDVTNAQGGTGTKVINNIIKKSRTNGFKTIELDAIGDPTTLNTFSSGYYSWPRMGFDAAIPNESIVNLPEALSKSKRLSDLMKTEKGRNWWRDIGGTDTTVIFDLSPTSISSKVMNEYAKAKGI